ncbi:apolipoprotein N-acyltransferase [Paremcibacter congregatus]|uniref:apolipoprotein N-acyltransferase n=1 Tax=Paremcibacter congregatus TaxID=2043170 RepID=UPI0030EDCA38|tara:strand:+ start:28485 stop:30074 length:1590 start_codon:yes stop_codon:yes gene_type:complete
MDSNGVGTFYSDRITDWLHGRSGGQLILLVFIGGVLSGLSFAPLYLIPLLAVAYPLLLMVVFQSKSPLEAMAFGWWFGFGQLFMGTTWIASAFEVDGRYPGWTGYLAVACLAMVLALYYGLATGLLWRFFRRLDLTKNRLSLVLAFVVLWSGAEWLRGHFFTGFPWNLTGYAWGFSDIMLQTTALWGIYGLGVLTIFLALVPYLLIHAPLKSKLFSGSLGAAVVLILGMIVYGVLQLSIPTSFHENVKLKIVQANINQNDKWDPAKKADNFITYLNMSKARPEEGITHVIWPETAVVYFLDTEPSRRYLIAEFLKNNAVLMTGFPRVKREPELQAWNSFAVIDQEAQVQYIYDKNHLVPFGEYTPDFLHNSLSFLGLGMMVEGFSYSRGEGLETYHPAGMPSVGVLICYEIIFPGSVVDRDDRPDWLLNITNDAWYGRFNGPYQHFLQTRVRAIEEGRPVVRSAGTGISAVIDSQGRVIKALDLNQRGTITSGLPVKRAGRTLYSSIYDWTYLTIMLLLSGLVILFLRQ